MNFSRFTWCFFNCGMHNIFYFWASLTVSKILLARERLAGAEDQSGHSGFLPTTSSAPDTSQHTVPTFHLLHGSFDVKAQFFQWFRRVASFSTFEHTVAVTHHIWFIFWNSLWSLQIMEFFILDHFVVSATPNCRFVVGQNRAEVIPAF